MSSITLILNAAEGLLQIVALQNGVRLFAQEWQAPTRGTEILAPAIAEAFAHLRLSMMDIERIASVNGPGSFTGLRLALATAAGIARTTKAQQAGLDYMHLLADKPFVGAGDMVWVLTHARRNLVHAQGFIIDTAGALPRAFCPVEALSLEQAVERILMHSSHDEEEGMVTTSPPVVLGSGLTRNYDFFAEHISDGLLMTSDHDVPSIAALIHLTEHAAWQDEDIAPFYLRPCDAEENLPYIAAKQGRDGNEAQEQLAILTHKSVEDSLL